jgi:hypothetical protein
MPKNPKIKARKRIETLQHHKALIDGLIRFIRAHPTIMGDAKIISRYGKNALAFQQYALIIPYWSLGNITLRLVKAGEDWQDVDGYDKMEKVVSDDVSGLSDKQLGVCSTECISKCTQMETKMTDEAVPALALLPSPPTIEAAEAGVYRPNA